MEEQHGRHEETVACYVKIGRDFSYLEKVFRENIKKPFFDPEPISYPKTAKSEGIS
jgi:hypothetical protein